MFLYLSVRLSLFFAAGPLASRHSVLQTAHKLFVCLTCLENFTLIRFSIRTDFHFSLFRLKLSLMFERACFENGSCRKYRYLCEIKKVLEK